MPSDLVIHAEGLGKCYRLPGRRRLSAVGCRLSAIGCRPERPRWAESRKPIADSRTVWALRDASFDVARGETVGVIGPNGSGKSTLLQILAGTLMPSAGRVWIRGRVAALLELGSGFDPEFTGRENVYLYAAILGLTPGQIEQRLQAIAEFADIGDYIDRPLKTYSTGMMVRLAFAVATSVDPDLLLIDEALAVGDVRFQQRSMARIRQLQERGVSILLVSHDLEAVKRLCRRVLVLDRGRLVRTGPPDAIVNWYLGWMTEPESGVRSQESGIRSPRLEVSPRISGVEEPRAFEVFRHGDGNARIVNVQLLNADGAPAERVRLGDECRVRIEVEVLRTLPTAILGFYLRDRLGTDVIGVNTHQEGTPLPAVRPGDRVTVEFALSLRLRPGHYSISPALAYNPHEMRYLDWIDHALVFEIVDPRPGRTVFGLLYPDVRTTTSVERADAAVPA